MPPTNLQGLNVVHPVSDSSQDLLSGPPFPDLSAQLDLWTNLNFESDDGPLGPRNDDNEYGGKSHGDEEEEEARSPATGEKAIHDGHINVVTGTNIGSNQTHSAPLQQQPPAFDINSFLAGFGIDPFSAVPMQHAPSAVAPSIAQLLALHQPQIAPYSAQTSLLGQSHYPGQQTSQAFANSNPAPTEELYPPTKRSRTRKASISSVASPESYREETPGAGSTPLSAAEDKRRRNTAASARFRLKKKEREAALEGKAKELETRVNELERECEGLRRENGWLKGLVVGVTGAAQGPAAPQNVTPPPAIPSVGSKRGRDESDGV